MNFFEFTLKWKGFPFAEAKSRLQHQRTLSNKAFADYQEAAKWRIFEYHRIHTAWYKNRIDDHTIDGWESIPCIGKNDFQRELNALFSNEYNIKNVYLNNTSGSTGKPFHFAKDKFAHAMTWAYIIKKYDDLGLQYGSSMQARFFGIPLTKAAYYKEKVKDFFSARVRFPVFDLSDNKLEEYTKEFYKTKFEYIYGYTSSLVLFAQYLDKKNVVLKNICPTLKYCIVTSEVCSPADRSLLEKAFDVKVINEYGAAELDIIAFEDRDGDWLLNEDNLFIEVVDEQGRVVPNGVSGNVVVTSLYNKAMPFVRYNLGDVMTISPVLKGHHRKIQSMDGRTNDVALLPSGKKSPGLTFYYISKSLLKEGGFIKEFIIKQEAIDSFHFEYVADHILQDEQEKKIKEMMDIYLEPGLKATFERKEKIERTAAGKFKHFQSCIKWNNL